MNHVIVRQTDSRHQSLDSVLKGQHQDGRSSTQTSKQRRGVFVDDDGNDDDDGNEDDDDLRHATD